MPVYREDPKATARGKATAENMSLAPKGKPSSRKLWIVLFNHEKDGHVLPSSLTFDSEADARRAQKSRRGARLQSRAITVASIVAGIVAAELAMCSPARSEPACPYLSPLPATGLGTPVAEYHASAGGTVWSGIACPDRPMVGGQDTNIWNTGFRVYLITGENPESEGYVSVDMGTLYKTHWPNGSPIRPICVANTMTTLAEYSSDWPTPEWPGGSSVNGASYSQANSTHDFRWWSPAPLEARSAYTINIVCARRDPDPAFF